MVDHVRVGDVGLHGDQMIGPVLRNFHGIAPVRHFYGFQLDGREPSQEGFSICRVDEAILTATHLISWTRLQKHLLFEKYKSDWVIVTLL